MPIHCTRRHPCLCILTWYNHLFANFELQLTRRHVFCFLWRFFVFVINPCLENTVKYCKRQEQIINNKHLIITQCHWLKMDRRGRDRMVVGFTTTYAISAYHNWYCEFKYRAERGVQHVIKFVSDLRQING